MHRTISLVCLAIPALALGAFPWNAISIKIYVVAIIWGCSKLVAYLRGYYRNSVNIPQRFANLHGALHFLCQIYKLHKKKTKSLRKKLNLRDKFSFCKRNERRKVQN